MNKAEFVELIAKKTDLPKSKCNLFLNENNDIFLAIFISCYFFTLIFSLHNFD